MERVLSRRLAPSIGQLSLRRILLMTRLWLQRARTRRQLAALDDHQLADIGVSHSERLAELDKPFWR